MVDFAGPVTNDLLRLFAHTVMIESSTLVTCTQAKVTTRGLIILRCCLDLINEPVDDVIAECQLIEAIGILATCQVTIIPVQGLMLVTAVTIVISILLY